MLAWLLPAQQCHPDPPRAAGIPPQYLWRGAGRASLLSAVLRGLPGRAVEGRWTWLRADLQRQKPLEETPAFGCTQAPARSCAVLGEGGGGGNRGVRCHRCTGLSRNTAMAPKLEQLQTQAANPRCSIVRLAPQGSLVPVKQLIGAALGCMARVLGRYWAGSCSLCQAPRLQRYRTKGGEELPPLPTAPPTPPSRGPGTTAPRGDGRTP